MQVQRQLTAGPLCQATAAISNKDYRTASNVGRPLINVVTPRNVANDLLRSLMIETLIDCL